MEFNLAAQALTAKPPSLMYRQYFHVYGSITLGTNIKLSFHFCKTIVLRFCFTLTEQSQKDCWTVQKWLLKSYRMVVKGNWRILKQVRNAVTLYHHQMTRCLLQLRSCDDCELTVHNEQRVTLWAVTLYSLSLVTTAHPSMNLRIEETKGIVYIPETV